MERFTKFTRATPRAAIGISGFSVSKSFVSAVAISAFGICAAVAMSNAANAQEPAQAQAQPKPQAAPATAAEAKQQAGAAARRSYDAGIKSYSGGKHQLAVDQLSSALRAGGLGSAEMAKSLYVRGVAYKKLNKPGLAISDLTSALWLKNGLGEGDQKAAMSERAEAYRMAGLGDGNSGSDNISVADPNPSPAGAKAAVPAAPAVSAPAPPVVAAAANVETMSSPIATPTGTPTGQVTRQSPDSEAARDAANARRNAALPVDTNGLQPFPSDAATTKPQVAAAQAISGPGLSLPGLASAPPVSEPSAPVLSAAPVESPPQGDAPVTSTSNGPSTIGGFFSNLFSGGASNAPAQVDQTGVTTASTTPPPATSSWSDATSVANGATKPSTTAKPIKVAAATPVPAPGIPAPAAAPAFKGGKYKLHIAAVRSRAEAEALARKLAAQQGPALKSRVPVVDEAVIGSMGTFYRVRVGSFANADEPRGVCNTLRSSGFDCLVVTN